MSEMEFLESLTRGINLRIDVPLVGETTEEKYIRSGLTYVVPYIPDSVRPLLFDAEDGLNDDERNEHAAKTLERAVQFATRQTPEFLRPFAQSQTETVLRPLIDQVFAFVQRGLAIGLPQETDHA